MIAIAAMLAAAAQAGAAAEPVITEPDWLRKPTAEEIESHYPRLMSFLGIEGHATIRCKVTVAGDPSDCVLLFESPAGVGFGPAALSLAPSLKFTPRKVNGVPVSGGTVNVPVTFTLDDGDTREPATAHPVDAETQTLAMRLAQLLDGPRFKPGGHNPAEAAAMAAPIEGVARDRQRMVEAFDRAFADYGPEALQRRASVYAQLLNPQELRDTVAFFESASGQAFLSRLAAPSPLMRQALRQEHAAIVAAAMRIYCEVPGSCPAVATRAKPGASKP